jgi:hypothetical protein
MNAKDHNNKMKDEAKEVLPTYECWVNIYPDGGGYVYSTKESAKMFAGGYAIRVAVHMIEAPEK